MLVHGAGALIIDLGMCLRIPYSTDEEEELEAASIPKKPNDCGADDNNNINNDRQLSASFQSMNMGCSEDGSTNLPSKGTPKPILEWVDHTGGQQQNHNRPPLPRQRRLIRPQGTCGKWIYMSPEILRNKEPFDGHTVDLWAAGVVLFLMLTGFPPWERACVSDERFKYMSAGYLVQMLTEWNLGLSSDAMDLLQRMLFQDPKDRLSLEQVRAHPWMIVPTAVAAASSSGTAP